jgi:nitrogen-specific signal transduction histidine kinase
MDPGRMEQVFLDVAKNAIQAMDPRGTTHQGARAGGSLTLVQEILHQHHFQYSLDSPPGGPTRFEMVF